MTGLCPTDCGRHVRAGHLMCGTCWKEVPAHVQRDVYRTWRAYNREPTDAAWVAYDEARQVAIGAVA